MSSLAPDSGTLEVEVSNISSHGVWLLVRDKELYISYDDFPWFKEQTIQSIIKVEEQSSGHLYWPELDIDLTVEIIEHPERFPLQARVN
ncbi:MAG: DUF2442 domain-containing protein [Gammaproteobacteria bacterium]|nr:DUF2442 domain-containing protein [Gammaproteobacteria bacterium]